MGNLTPFRSKGPPLIAEQEDRPDLAAIRDPQHVVVHLEEPQAGYQADYYLASITPKQLEEKLKES